MGRATSAAAGMYRCVVLSEVAHTSWQLWAKAMVLAIKGLGKLES